jgi:hypothetical protein
LRINVEDDSLAWQLHADGTWTPPPKTTGLDAHAALEADALLRGHLPVRRPDR